jgi:hypothetical protein
MTDGVKFIRVRGRVVPVRAKKGDDKKPASAAGIKKPKPTARKVDAWVGKQSEKFKNKHLSMGWVYKTYESVGGDVDAYERKRKAHVLGLYQKYGGK